MIGIFSSSGLAALSRFRTGRPLLAFDFDGTLAPLVPRREEARLATTTRWLLRQAAQRHTVAVISGRSRADLAPRLAGIQGVTVLGNHGAEAEAGPVDAELRGRVAAWARTLRSVFARTRGVEVEDKGLSLAVHYRDAHDRGRARERITSAARAFPDARVTGGISVVNIVPAELPHKGRALEKLASDLDRDRVLFVGDDLTDEDAFEAPCVDVSVRVGRELGSAASYYLDSQAELDRLLAILVGADLPPYGGGE
ncbi:MAG: trehalose-phosphatase [Anaeromyxobacter sp.]